MDLILASQCDMDRCLLGFLLAQDGLDTVEVRTTDTLLAAVRQAAPQLVILDTLGWLSGALNALRALRDDPCGAVLPVMLLGDPVTQPELLCQIRTDGVTWFPRQGFTIELLIEKVRQLAQQSAMPPSIASSARGDRQQHPACTALEPALIEQTLSQAGAPPAFEFSITDAITTHCDKDQVVDHIVSIVQRDVLLALNLLSRSNREAVERSCPGTTDLREAVTVLGGRTFYQFAESITPLTLSPNSLWDAGHFWAHSVLTSRLAVLLSRKLGLGSPAEALSAGLLHDIGFFTLAQNFPEYYGRLISASFNADTLSADWEQRIIGLHHGLLGALVLRHYGLPCGLQEVVTHHHLSCNDAPGGSGSCRLMAILVRAADQIADVVFPGDPPLTPLMPFDPHLEKTLLDAELSLSRFAEAARNVAADILSEMNYLFPQTLSRSYYYVHRPLEELMYIAPRQTPQDLIRLHLELRAENVVVPGQGKTINVSRHAPLVVNLTRVPDVAAQVEMLTSLMSNRMLANRRTLMLVDADPPRALQTLASATCRFARVPINPGRWMRWLAARDEEIVPDVSVHPARGAACSLPG